MKALHAKSKAASLSPSSSSMKGTTKAKTAAEEQRVESHLLL